MTYQEALNFVASLEPRGWRLGLDRMEALCLKLGLEKDTDGSTRSYFHVAGTNGKGSTTLIIQYLLHGMGLKVGAFFSPYVVDPRERIQVGLDLISEETYAKLVEEILPVAESMAETEFGGITEFEFKTAMGFECWKQARCEAVALETGLGGRLDATNVVTPACSSIVSIGLDHQAILGNTFEAIAGEKAGIIKQGRPAVIGNLPRTAVQRISEVAHDKNSTLYKFGEHFSNDETGRFESIWGDFECASPVKLKGKWQVHNFAVALASVLASGMRLTQSDVTFAAENAFLPGRFQQMEVSGVPIILDGAHNLDSARALVETFQNDFNHFSGQKAILISNMVQGHDAKEFYKVLLPVSDRIFVPPINFHRARSTEEIVKVTADLGLPAQGFQSMADCLEEAIKTSQREGLPILITGSFYLVGDAIRALQN